jgi:hypothetical protein
MDIAGGAGLECDQRSSNYKLELKYPARTRTNACYALHKECARQLVDNFFPLCFPIDWHLQWIMSSSNMDGCYWTIKPPLIHGSEKGLVESWRRL